MPEKNELKIAEIRGDLKNLSQRVSSAFPDANHKKEVEGLLGELAKEIGSSVESRFPGKKTEEEFLKKLAASDKESYGINPNPGINRSEANKDKGQGR